MTACERTFRTGLNETISGRPIVSTPTRSAARPASWRSPDPSAGTPAAS